MARSRTHTRGLPFVSLAVLLALIAVARPASADPAQDSTTVVDQTISGMVSEQAVQIPAGVRAIDVIAIGGNGGDKGSIHGGLPAQVTGRLPVTEDSAIFVSIGGNGSSLVGNPAAGGINGGGQGGYTGANAYGAGGGGATDIRTVQSFNENSLESRVVVAGGGGGAGSTANGTGAKAGGAGGDAGATGIRAESAGPGNTIGSGGFGGGPGTASSGGGGGQAGFPYGSSGSAGSDGQTGSLAQGGLGGVGPTNSPPGGGGGGGGGLYGGGGGGGGGFMTGGSQAISTGGGGGGGGSSLAPAGGTISVAADPATPSVNIKYTIPGTDIVGGPTVIGDADAQFEFTSTETGSTFECRLDDGSYEDCASPYVWPDPTEGEHSFAVRSVNEMGNYDASPATRSFEVDRTAPKATIDSGPSGETTERRPQFTFTVDENPVTASCRYDSGQWAACTTAGSDRPAADLAEGAHTFQVFATDQAGNQGPTASRAFTVVADSGPPSPGAKLILGKAKVNRKKGFATLAARVNMAGKVALLGTRTVRSQAKKVGGPRTVRLRVVAKGRALRKLRRSGRLKVTARVRFTPVSGSARTRAKKITLRSRRP